jgi:hypothetical protein
VPAGLVPKAQDGRPAIIGEITPECPEHCSGWTGAHLPLMMLRRTVPSGFEVGLRQPEECPQTFNFFVERSLEPDVSGITT